MSRFAERGFNFFRFEHEPPVLSLLMNCDLPWNLDYLDKEV